MQALKTLDDGGGSAATAPATHWEAVGQALEDMGNCLWTLLECASGSHNNGSTHHHQDSAAYVAYFSRAASTHQAAGRRERAAWCLERAMRYSQALEAAVADAGLPAERRQGYVVALFGLYLEGSTSAADRKQQVDACSVHASQL